MLWKFPPPLSAGPYVSHGEKGGLSIEAGIGSETKNKSYFNSRLSFHWINSTFGYMGKFCATNETGDFRTLFAQRVQVYGHGAFQRGGKREGHIRRRQTMIRRRRRPLRTCEERTVQEQRTAAEASLSLSLSLSPCGQETATRPLSRRV